MKSTSSTESELQDKIRERRMKGESLKRYARVAMQRSPLVQDEDRASIMQAGLEKEMLWQGFGEGMD